MTALQCFLFPIAVGVGLSLGWHLADIVWNWVHGGPPKPPKK